jgi:SAM-dependent methyltransferase
VTLQADETTVAIATACPVCNGSGTPAAADLEGYLTGWRTALMLCTSCDLTFSTRRDIPPGLYESIYRNSSKLPGYHRYDRYEKHARRQGTGLAWLASQEAPYAAVEMFLSQDRQHGPIMELGCGRGYLTQALRRDGMDAVGVDISREVVETARTRWADDSAFLTVDEAKEAFESGFQTVIALEVVEHVTSPLAFLKEALDYLVPGGRLVLSTPNRDAYASNVIWASDVPPVHLTWFGSKALAAMATLLGCEVEFLRMDEGTPFPLARAATPLGGLLTSRGQPTKLARLHASDWAARLANQLGRARLAVRPDAPEIVGMPRD